MAGEFEVINNGDHNDAWLVDPLSKTGSFGMYDVSQYYGYDGANLSSANTPDHLEASATLSVFLFEDATELSLVFISDRPNDGSGSALNLEVAGLHGATWTVQDDPGDSSYFIDPVTGVSSVSFVSSACCTDGGALTFGHRNIDVTLTILHAEGLDTLRVYSMDGQGVIGHQDRPLSIGGSVRLRTSAGAIADADGDGVVDDDDVCPGFDDALDLDHDGVPDGCDPCANDADNDLDGDGICGDVDACPNDANNDIDGDSLCGDVDPCPYDVEDDVDGDGVCGDIDPCPYDFDNDVDGDGLCGDVDPCPYDVEDDVDGDGVCGDIDPCPYDFDNDVDGDGLCGDVDPCPYDVEDDVDGDGLCGDVDPCPDDVDNLCGLPVGGGVGDYTVIPNGVESSAWLVDPLSKTGSFGMYDVSQYYGYDGANLSSANTPDHLEASATLSVFLFEDATELSLVFISDRPNDGSGSALNLEVAGLHGATWTVQDDPGDSSYFIDPVTGVSSVSFVSSACCTDGGALTFGHRNIDVTLTILHAEGLDTIRVYSMDDQGVISHQSLPLAVGGSVRIVSDASAHADADADGVPDAHDVCQGFDDAVDLDQDGVPDGCDNCFQDPNANQADRNGDGFGDVCAPDFDGDGVVVDFDTCPGTMVGAVVDASGCSIEQLVPCDASWPNRGAYLNAVAQATEELVAAGWMTVTEAREARVSAARSDCPLDLVILQDLY